ncbi:GNAT family N-acetyltransferase [Bacillus bingmayongensis]|uniref:GNAT family N-acetyltransferase n=1 Tax=Bacillus bingmayongensis TaxID=1150157 RepID=UPI0002EF2D93|nr:GNAT family N-acetyltransferase [Bacillus bingmayongensis]MBY0599279.1 GNAT family N-acetyltransferase [Bacillus bingmayongensis]
MNILHEIPNVKEYMELRKSVGLNSQKKALTKIALSNSTYSVIVRGTDSKLLGMGRVIGDGAYFFQIVDIIVSPLQKDKGIEDIILKGLLTYLDGVSSENTRITVMADVSSIKLYQKFGFNLVYPDFYGMSRSL